MHASIKILGSVFVLLSWAGCGDALDLGQSGEGTGTLNECVNPGGVEAPPVCAACGAVGGMCAGADRTTCCCSPAVETGGEARWQCYSDNSNECPAAAPPVGSACPAPTPAAALSCRYCTPNGLSAFSCVEGTWQASSVGLSNC